MAPKKVFAVKSENTAYIWDIHNYLRVVAFDVKLAVKDLSISKERLGITSFEYETLMAGEGVADIIKNNLRNTSSPGLTDIFRLNDGNWTFFIVL